MIVRIYFCGEHSTYEQEKYRPIKMCLLNMMIGTHLLIFLIALENFKLAKAYHISVEPQSTLKYNGHIVSSYFFVLFYSISRSSLLFPTQEILIGITKQTVNKLLPKVRLK